MMGVLRIELDSIRKQRNAREWRNIGRARCEGHERTGDGRNLALLASDMVNAGYDPARLVEVYREGTPCFTAAPLGAWASGKVGKVGKGEQPEQLRQAERVK